MYSEADLQDLQEEEVGELMFQSIESGDKETVSSILSLHFDASSWCFEEYNILHAAAIYGQSNILQTILDVHPELINSVSEDSNETALILAVQNNHVDVVQALLRSGATVDVSTSEEGWQAIHEAVKNFNCEVVGMLLNAGANIEAQNADESTPLLLAAQSQTLDDFKANLIEDEDDAAEEMETEATAVDRNEETPEDLQCKMVKYLILRGADLMYRCSFNESIVHISCKGGNLSLLRYLLEDMQLQSILTEQSTGSFHGSPFTTACGYGSITLLQYLLESFGGVIDVNQNGAGQPPLIAAASRSSAAESWQVIELLLQHGVDINTVNAKNETALFAVTKRGDLHSLRSLLQRNARYDIASSESGYAPVSIAASRDFLEGFQELVQRDMLQLVNVRDSHGNSILGTCAAMGSEQVTAWIISNLPQIREATGANLLEIGDNYGDTPLHRAAGCGNIQIMTMLLDAGAPINARNNSGQTAYMYSKRYGRNSSASFLLQRGADPSLEGNQ